MARQTSLAAYRAIKESGTLSARRWQAYDALYRQGPMTGQELAACTKIPGMWKRCAELSELGLVYEAAVRACRVTGQAAVAWDVTAAMPAPPEEKRQLRTFWLVKRPGRIGQAFVKKSQAETAYATEQERLANASDPVELIAVKEILPRRVVKRE